MKKILSILLFFITFFSNGFAQTEVSFTIDKNPLFNGTENFEESSRKLKGYVNGCGLSIGGGKEAVFIQFTINQEGEVIADSFVLVGGEDKELFNKAVECLKKTPKWTPAEYKGGKVTCNFHIPIKK